MHIDHVGRIPYLLVAGFRGPIYCSEASALLPPLVPEDALKVGVNRNASLIKRFLGQIWRQVVALPYKKWRSVTQGVSVKLHPAGHILGSAYVEFKVESSSMENALAKRNHRVVFFGDLGASHTPLLPAPRPPWRADLLVLESTYGDRLHENRTQRQMRLGHAIEHALVNRGTILVPAFSIGRTQELLYDLESLIHRMGGRRLTGSMCWSDLEVIVDSPLAAKMTDCYLRLRHLWDNEARRRVNSGRYPLNFEQLYTVESHDEHRQTVAYLASSGRHQRW
ncbi:MBL fold metallo-hydrolase [Sedimenticola selenatireducens]|uniref:MBL fold metallo-hydrolase n=1 Tax=Sedimenticola selenatireducens TaxID=191960 RepID=UPI002FF6D3F6